MTDRDSIFDVLPIPTCAQMTMVLNRFPTVESLMESVLTMACLRRHCLEVPVHEMDCAIGDPDHPLASVIQGFMEESIGGKACDEEEEEK